MNNLSIFAFEEKQIRAVMIDGEPWFVAKDVTSVLGCVDEADEIKKHCKDVKSLNSFDFGVLPEYNKMNVLHPQTLVIPESDIYSLIVKSKLTAATAFEKNLKFVKLVDMIYQLKQNMFYRKIMLKL